MNFFYKHLVFSERKLRNLKDQEKLIENVLIFKNLIHSKYLFIISPYIPQNLNVLSPK